jgi:hypothetical protein
MPIFDGISVLSREVVAVDSSPFCVSRERATTTNLIKESEGE